MMREWFSLVRDWGEEFINEYFMEGIFLVTIVWLFCFLSATAHFAEQVLLLIATTSNAAS